MRLIRILPIMGLTALAAGCGSELSIYEDPNALDIERASDPETAAEAELRASSVYDAEFQQAGQEFNIPAALLKSIAFTETRYEMVVGDVEFEGRPVIVGVMGLSESVVARGAELAGVTEEQVRTDPLSNIRAAAALLDAHAKELSISRSDVRNFAPAVAKLSAVDDADAQKFYVRDEVFETLKLGVGAPSQELGLVGQALELDGEFGTLTQELTAAPDYPKAVWRPSPNFDSRATKPGMVIIHTCEGSYTGCWSWLGNKAAGASAHYVVNNTGSEISQLVRESNRAWHIAAAYDCKRNSGVDCSRNGMNSNHFTVGIEHAGFAKQSSWPAGQINASAALVCDITKAHGIPRDRFHIVGHGKLQPWNRTDPGPNWPWTTYISKVNSACGSGGGGGGGGTPTTGQIVIDSNNSNNKTSQYYVQVSSNWTSSNSTAGYYGTGYWYANTKPVSDGATFWFYLPSNQTRTIDTWYTAGANRSPSVPFVAFNASGAKVGTKYVNQQVNGKKWVTVGTFNFTKGWNKVVLSRWTGAGKVVIADAVRVR